MRFGKVLPVTAGLVSIALMVWDVYEKISTDALEISDFERSPIPLLLLFTLNAPLSPLLALAFFIFGPALPIVYLFCLPIIGAWWWWLGTRLDLGWLSKEPGRYPHWTKFLVGLVGALLVIFAIQDCANAYRYISASVSYSLAREMWRAIGPLGVGLWCAALAWAAARTTITLFRGAPGDSPGNSAAIVAGSRFSTAGFWVVTFAVLLVAAGRIYGVGFEFVSIPKAPRVFSAVSGVVSDDSGKFLDHVVIELLPDDTARRTELAEIKGGRFAFKVEPGAYRLALNCKRCLSAPTAASPFQTIFYPGVETEAEAARLVVKAGVAMQLEPMRAHRVAVATIPAEVKWSNGVDAKGSGFVINNLDYPNAIVESKPSQDGKGDVVLPVGFRYRARASVTCDGGRQLSFHESRPLLEFAVGPGVTPKSLRFVIPELPCRVWVPK